MPGHCSGCLTLQEHQKGPALQWDPPASAGALTLPPPSPPYRAGSRSTPQPPDCSWQSLPQSFSSLPAFPPRHESSQNRTQVHTEVFGCVLYPRTGAQGHTAPPRGPWFDQCLAQKWAARESDDGSLQGLGADCSNHTWTGPATVRAGKQSFLALSKSLPSPGHPAHRQTLPYFNPYFGGPDSREQLRVLSSYSPPWTVRHCPGHSAPHAKQPAQC